MWASRIFEKLWPTIPVRFSGDFDLATSAQKLRDATARNFFERIYARNKLGGTVTPEQVILWRATRNVWAPVFFGGFSEESGRAVLAGRFTSGRLLRAMTTFVFVFCGLIAIFRPILFLMLHSINGHSLRYDLDHEPGAGWGYFFLGPLLGSSFMVAFWWSAIRFNWWIARGDVAFLRVKIETALGKDAAN